MPGEEDVDPLAKIDEEFAEALRASLSVRNSTVVN
jgi:hypothetical protein